MTKLAGETIDARCGGFQTLDSVAEEDRFVIR
jgi:hypothetical protein